MDTIRPGVHRLWNGVAALGWFVCMTFAQAATYHVAESGSDTNPGSDAAPWRTIQQAANTALAGDTVVVHAGDYPERIATKRGGSGESGRIVYQTDGTVVVRGWNINHPFVTVRGFEVTGHSGANNADAHVIFGNNGDSILFEQNTVRDGIYISRTNIAFHHNAPDPDTITCETGGFLAAGFKPGQTVFMGRAIRVNGPANSGVTTLQAVTDTTLTVNTVLTEEAASPVYLSASYMYGLTTANGTENCLIRSNTFRNLSFDTWFISGINNRLENNRIEATQGWDAIHFMGTNNVFRFNFIHNSPLVVYQISPDAFENISVVRFDNIFFDHNFIYGFDGVITSEKGVTGDAGPLTYSHNVIVNTGSINIRYPHTSFINNTFLNASVTGNAVAAPLKHPILFEAFNSADAIVKNNIFVGCGSGRTPDQQGWYEFQGGAETAIVSRNFVAGPAPNFASKAGFTEGVPSLNGGDPGFVNINDPLGPDGQPFTDDDGLRLQPTSKLAAAAESGEDLGAYDSLGPIPVLERIDSAPGTLSFRWPREAVGFFLEWAPSLDGPWLRSTKGAIASGAFLTQTVTIDPGIAFYRLAY